MVENKKPSGVKALAAMFEANLSQVKTENPVRKPVNKLPTAATHNPPANPFPAETKPANPPAQKAPAKLMTSVFEQNIQSQTQAPPVKKPVPPKTATTTTPASQPAPVPAKPTANTTAPAAGPVSHAQPATASKPIAKQ